MKKNSKLILGGVLAAQLVLSAGLFVTELRSSAGAEPVPLLGFDRNEVDRIVMDDRTNEVVITKVGDGWQLPDLETLEANSSKIDTLFNNLSGLNTRWPVVASQSGRQRFEVEESNYQRKLSFYQGDKLLGSYYFGTSPGFRRTHVRRDGEGEVYVVAFNNFDLPTDDNDWLEKTLLAVKEPTRIEGEDYTLIKEGENWQLADVTDAPSLKQSEVDALARSWRSLRVMRVAESEVPEDATVNTVKVASSEGEWTYTFSKGKDTCFVQRSGLDTRFTVTLADCDKLGGTRRTALVEVPQPAAAEGEDAKEEGDDSKEEGRS